MLQQHLEAALPASSSTMSLFMRITRLTGGDLFSQEYTLNTLSIPVYFAVASALVLLLQSVFSSGSTKVFDTQEDASESAPVEYGTSTKQDERVTFLCLLSRVVGCFGLLGLSVYSAFLNHDWVHLALVMVYAYAFVLTLVASTSCGFWGGLAASHSNAILLSIFSVYALRDIFPLATTTKTPENYAEGFLLWARIITLTITGVVVPLITPREYIPFNPNDSKSIPNLEQTASVWSLLTYSFMDRIVFLASRVSHLSPENLPPLADYDSAKNLKEKSLQRIDLGDKGHIFFKFLRVFREEYLAMSVLLVLQAITSFASPIGINQLLHYLETGGSDTAIRPWVWIACLFVGPFISSITLQWYIYLSSRTITQIEAVITQLVYEHALRIRIEAETSATTDISAASLHEESSLGGQNTCVTVSETEVAIRDTASEVIEPTPASSNLVGKINNIVTNDMLNIREARDFLSILIYIPLNLTLATCFLYVILGWSAFVGLGVIMALFPLPGYVASLIQAVEVTRMKKTDARVQTVTETMNMLRMIKLFGWESKTNKKIEEKREEELVWMWRRSLLNLTKGFLNFVIPVATMMATYGTYTLVMKQDLNASKVFSSMAVFDILRGQLHLVFHTVSQVVTGKVSLDRINDFLRNTELLDSFSEKMTSGYQSETNTSIGFCNASFTWSTTYNSFPRQAKRSFLLRVDGELVFKQNAVNLIVGPTGSGKTSLLMALLGEMHFIPTGSASWFNLPREKGVAYAAQESWVINATVKDNILFGAKWDEKRYKKVIRECCLEQDLGLLAAGDETEVGEKGLTLSGGQKARITLTRAIYSDAQVLLLDDVFAALDVHTAKWIVDECFRGDLVKGRTILLVTHNLALTQPIAEFVVSISSDGTITSQDSLFEVLSKDNSLAKEALHDQELLDELEPKNNTTASAVEGQQESQADGKLIVAEDVEVGNVSWSAMKLYLSGLGGNHPFWFFLFFVGGIISSEFLFTAQTWYIGHWASQYDAHPGSEVDVLHYLGVYGLILLSASTVFLVACVVYIFGTMRASRLIHKRLVHALLGTTLRWLDVTPTSRVIARCTQDIGAIDGPIAGMIQWLTEVTVAMVVKLGAVVILTPVFLGPGIALAVLGAWLCRVYMAAQLSVKREMSNAKSPIVGHFGTTISGLVSIRAYGAQTSFIEESIHRIDRHTRAARTFFNLNRWITVRIDALGGIFTASLAAYLVYFQNQNAANTGFALNMAVAFSGMILYWVQFLNELEIQGNSLERIEGYTHIEQEPKSTEHGVPPAYWPASGELRVEKLSASYSPGGDKVLSDISFSVKAGERVGIVGRTGSGKSSLALTLLRAIFTEGSVYYDGLRINSVNLDALRSNITIIPQVPEMLSGTLRQNFDPFDQFDDATLNAALRAAGLFSLQCEGDEGRITLDTAISSSGGNLSVGQRQILALARAIVRGSKLLILDEATSAIDHGTDSVIQSSLRHALGRDVTLITVAHRLQTIMDADKIMVLDAGRMVEFDSPDALLTKENGKFRALVEEAGGKDALIAT